MRFPFGLEDVAFPEGHLRLTPLIPALRIAEDDPDAKVSCAIDHPIGAAPLEETVSAGDRVTIILPDITRLSGARSYLPLLTERLQSCGLLSEHIRLLIGLGIHRPMTDEECRLAFGEALIPRFPLMQHCAHDPDALVFTGETSRGTPIAFHRLVRESDLTLVTGSVTFHYHAGYTGGRKGLLPGVASRDAALHNHRLVIDAPDGRHPACRPGNLDDNPVHLDMLEAARTVERVFCLNTVLDSAHRLLGAFAGDLERVHAEAAALQDAHFSLNVSERRPFLVASPGGYPHDLNLIQSHKTLEHVIDAVEPGGTIVLIARCGNGYGSAEFFPWFERHETAEAHLASLRRDFQIYGQTAYALRRKAADREIILFSLLPADEVAAMGLRPVESLEQAARRIRERHGTTAEGYVVPAGGKTLVRLRRRGLVKK